jgi:hypothetical protein
MQSLKNKLIVGQQMIKRKLGKTQQTSKLLLQLKLFTTMVVDEDYDLTHTRFEQNEKIAQNFAKHSAQLIENFHAMSSALHFLAEDCRDVYVNTSQEEKIKQMMSIAEEVERKCVLPFQEKVSSTVVDPVKQYQTQFPPLKELHSKRKTAMLQFEYHRDQVASLSEKTSKDPMALPKAKEKLQKAKEEFEQLDASAKNAFSEIVEQRTEVYDPALNSFIDAMISYYQNMANVLQDLKNVKTSGTITATSQMMSSPVQYPDTSNVVPSVSVPKPTASNIPPEYLDCEWFYLDDKVQQQGPLTFNQMKTKFKTGQLTPESHVFGADFADWKQIKSDAKLKAALSN